LASIMAAMISASLGVRGMAHLRAAEASLASQDPRGYSD